MKKVFILLFLLLVRLPIFAQSVYMHEAQEEDSLLDLDLGFLLWPIGIVLFCLPILVFILLGISMIKEKIEEFFSPSKSSKTTNNEALDYINKQNQKMWEEHWRANSILQENEYSEQSKTTIIEVKKDIKEDIRDYGTPSSCEEVEFSCGNYDVNNYVKEKNCNNIVCDEYGVWYSSDKRFLLQLTNSNLCE